MVSGPKGKNEKDYSHLIDVTISKEDNVVKIISTRGGRAGKRNARTVKAHIQNQIKGVQEGFKLMMQAVYTHFPIRIEVKGDKVYLHSFAGEKKPRVARIVPNVTVEVKGSTIIISGTSKEDVGQTAANIRQATRIVGLDNRVFQDGVYLEE